MNPVLADYDNLIYEAKCRIYLEEKRLEDLLYKRRFLLYRNLRPLEDLIRRYPRGGLSTGYTILYPRKLSPNLHKQIEYLFPYSGQGYRGDKNECILATIARFSPEEKDLLDQYGIDYKYTASN